MEERLPCSTVLDAEDLDAEDMDLIVDLLQSALPRRTREDAAACLSRHAWNLQSALQHIQGPAGLEQGVRWCTDGCVCVLLQRQVRVLCASTFSRSFCPPVNLCGSYPQPPRTQGQRHADGGRARHRAGENQGRGGGSSSRSTGAVGRRRCLSSSGDAWERVAGGRAGGGRRAVGGGRHRNNAKACCCRASRWAREVDGSAPGCGRGRRRLWCNNGDLWEQRTPRRVCRGPIIDARPHCIWRSLYCCLWCLLWA
jgi:hypothetical protein